MNGTYKIVLCSLRRLLKSDKLAAPIAGFFAGLCCQFDSDKRRRMFLLLFLSRMTEITYSMGEARDLCRQYDGGSLIMIFIS